MCLQQISVPIKAKAWMGKSAKKHTVHTSQLALVDPPANWHHPSSAALSASQPAAAKPAKTKAAAKPAKTRVPA
jgi:hypothetical protein